MYSLRVCDREHNFVPSAFASVYGESLAECLVTHAPPPPPKPEVVDPRKPILVLDLDNTLLHATSQVKLRDNVDADVFNRETGCVSLFTFTLPREGAEQLYYLKCRPFVVEFLRELSKVCTLCIHTNATLEYANVVVQILDADGQLFGDR